MPILILIIAIVMIISLFMIFYIAVKLSTISNSLYDMNESFLRQSLTKEEYDTIIVEDKKEQVNKIESDKLTLTIALEVIISVATIMIGLNVVDHAIRAVVVGSGIIILIASFVFPISSNIRSKKRIQNNDTKQTEPDSYKESDIKRDNGE